MIRRPARIRTADDLRAARLALMAVLDGLERRARSTPALFGPGTGHDRALRAKIARAAAVLDQIAATLGLEPDDTPPAP